MFLMVFVVFLSLPAQKKAKSTINKLRQKALSSEGLSFMHRIDYDFRHPEDEIHIYQLQQIFYPKSSASSGYYIEKIKQRLTDGLRDTSNLIDLISYYQKGYKDNNYQLWVIASMAHSHLPSLEADELTYLLKLDGNELRALSKIYADYLEKNDFPPR